MTEKLYCHTGRIILVGNAFLVDARVRRLQRDEGYTIAGTCTTIQNKSKIKRVALELA